MLRSLFARLVAFQLLLVVLEGFLFWLVAVWFDVPEPMSLIIVGAAAWVIAAIVMGVLLMPLDQVILAVKHAAAGEDVPLQPLRGIDESLAKAVAALSRKKPEQHSTDVLDSLSEGIMIVDKDLTPLVTNTALRSMAGVEGADLRHAFHARTFVPDQLALIEDEMRKAADRPRTDIVQLENPRQFLKRYSAPRQDGGWMISYQDITHEVEQDRLRQDFIANASHELRTPVTSVKVLLENLVDGAKDDLNVRDMFLDDALREIDRMHELVNDLLDIAALEAGRHNLQLTRVHLGEVIAEATGTVAPQAKQREVRLELDLPEAGGLALEADRTRVRQVLVNLVANAVKFTPAQGSVTVKAWREGEAIKIAIADTGIGIPAKDLPHIFDRFFRVTRGRTRLQGGSGLGLTIVKQAIDAHRGEIHVESTEGQGTTVYITLPVAQAAA